ncbi:trans-aconitate 2-methyltransferase [Poriferisphaera corsica]|uniref:Trans-aconitate 2-methyltransferase n=1 Tax=Poriferisphaera corsica TaxID=2528020 RepID=A0A517YR74_9BACT|nr:class I SAM-dependent methyltransferase [Poriferisphaera corsica]QDU32720.1 trans-aconitate 2-methyltransferase [Poriferisphaera corsica]
MCTSTTSPSNLAHTFDTWFSLFPNAESKDATQQDITALINATNIQPHHILWDLGCGTGRHLRELHHRNYHNIQGIDLSKAALTVAKQHATNPPIPYIQRDFRDHLVSSSQSADLIYSLDYTFSLFPPDELATLLKLCIQRLNRLGHIYIEMWDKHAITPKRELDITRAHTLSTGQFTYRGQYNPDTQTLQFKHTFTPLPQTTPTTPITPQKPASQNLPIQIHYLYDDQDLQTLIAPLGLKLTQSHQPTTSFSRHFMLSKT